jgi:hypothetical protein
VAALIWLVIPVAAVIGASVWGSWASRRRSATPDTVGVAGYEAFRAAMERSSVPGEAETAAPEHPVGRVPASASPPTGAVAPDGAAPEGS